MHHTKKRRIIFILIGLIIVHIILTYVKIPVLEEQEYNTTTSRTVDKNTTQPQIITVCKNETVPYTTEWQGWQDGKDNSIAPILNFTNNHTEIVQYTVEFLFFDSEKYTYEIYIGTPYEKVKEKLPPQLASMISRAETFVLYPAEQKVISFYTKKRNPEKTYWVYADVLAPEHEVCDEQVIYRNVTKQVIVQENITHTKNITVKVPLLTWLLDNIYVT